MNETQKHMLIVITSSIALLLWALLIILLVMIEVELNKEEYSYGTNFGLNWASSPTYEIKSEKTLGCPVGESYSFVQTYFPGFQQFCFCPKNNTYTPTFCGFLQVKDGCLTYNSTSPKTLVSWGGTLCSKRNNKMNYFNYNFSNSNNFFNECGKGYKDCGNANSIGEKLCVHKNEECPINYLKVININTTANTPELVGQRGFPVNETNFSDGQKKFIYSNMNNKGKTINQFTILDHKPCADSAENKIILLNTNQEYECKSKINGYTYDPSWTLIDTMTLKNLAKDNDLLS